MQSQTYKKIYKRNKNKTRNQIYIGGKDFGKNN